MDIDHIPLVDLKIQNDIIKEEVFSKLETIISKNQFILGENVSSFEKAFASFCLSYFCVGVGNGTDAIELAIRAMDIEPQSEILVPVNTFIATALAVVRAGHKPVFVDCDENYYLIDPYKIRFNHNTKAIIPVHLYGQMAPMEMINDIFYKDFPSYMVLIEDAAQSQGATRNGTPIKWFSHMAATSFYPGKNLGAWGDAGAVLTDDVLSYNKLKGLRNYGSEIKYHHPELGFNSRLDTIQAAVLETKLKYLDEWNKQRQEAAVYYKELLKNTPEIIVPKVMPGNVHVWHLYVVRVPDRDKVLKILNENNIGAAIHYPIPLHLQKAFKYLGYEEGDFPVAEKLSKEILSLPIYPGITKQQQERVAETLINAIRT